MGWARRSRRRMKTGHLAKADNDIDCLKRAEEYRSKLIPPEIFPIIAIRTDRGATYGVLVNMGEEKVIVWNAFSQKLDHYSINDYNNRVV